MNCEMGDVDSTLADIGRRCNPRLMEKMYTHYNQIKEDSHDEGMIFVGLTLAFIQQLMGS